jgi:hypothetical protein
MSWDPLGQPALNQTPTKPEVGDQIWLAQRWSPGLCDISGANSPREWEERKGYGWSGAVVVFRGTGLARFSVKLRLYTADDWLGWSTFKPLVDKPPPGKRPRAMDIWHPILVDQGIYSVVVEDLGQTEQTAEGEWTIEIKFVEYRFPKYALVKLEGTQATPDDPNEIKIARLTKEAADLAAEE